MDHLCFSFKSKLPISCTGANSPLESDLLSKFIVKLDSTGAEISGLNYSFSICLTLILSSNNYSSRSRIYSSFSASSFFANAMNSFLSMYR